MNKTDRRSYVKYAVVGVIVAAATGVGIYYSLRPPPVLTPTFKSPPTMETPATPSLKTTFILRSSDFEDDGKIPPKFTCDGENISPQLSWENVPDGTKSFALSVVDIDAPGGTFIHWLVYDIPGDVREIKQGGLPAGAKQVRNDFGVEEYRGPCPPHGTHRYIFTLYALDVERLEGVNKNNLFKIIGEHSIGKAELTGLYTSSQPLHLGA